MSAFHDYDAIVFTDAKNSEGNYDQYVNWHPQFPIIINGTLWLSVENYVQAQKFKGTPLASKIQKSYDTEQAKDLEKNKAVLDFVREDWTKVRDDVMLEALRAKFMQHKDLKRKLSRTESRRIIFKDSKLDSYWGQGERNSGKNRLGVLLMRVRSEIQGKKQQSQSSMAHSLSAESNNSSPTTSPKRSKSPDKPPKGTIYFHEQNYPYFEFSPYYFYEIRIHETVWPTVSHYFLGQRFAGSKLESKIQNCKSASEAMKIAYTPENQDFVRNDWKDVKDSVMKTGLKAKFLQYPEAKHLLLSTGNKLLVHHCNDNYWGDALDSSGQNMLGKYLMDIRKEMQNKDSDVRSIISGSSFAPSNPEKESRRLKYLSNLNRDPTCIVITNDKSNQYFCLSIYSDHPVTFQGKRWPSVSHYYNAMKFEGARIEEKIRSIKDPEEVPYFAYQHKEGVQKGWPDKREAVMLQALRLKFEQHPELVDVLLNTHPLKIHFHSEEDSLYGDGGDSSGQNKLGSLLEALRNQYLYNTTNIVNNSKNVSLSKQATVCIDNNDYEAFSSHSSPNLDSQYLLRTDAKIFSNLFNHDALGLSDNGNRHESIRFGPYCKKYTSFLPSSQHSIITKDGRHWPTVEHFYHAAKFHGGQFDEAISHVPSLEEVRKLVYSPIYQKNTRQDWNTLKDNYMLHGLRLKFEQYGDIRRALLQTGNALLIYDTERDEYWGYGIAGSGKNKLGSLLMMVRKEIQEMERIDYNVRKSQIELKRGHGFFTARQTNTSRNMTFADSPMDIIDRFIPKPSFPPLIQQQSFYDSTSSHTGNENLNSVTSPENEKYSYHRQRPSLEHQESFVVPNNSNKYSENSDIFDNLPLKEILAKMEKTSSPKRFDFTSTDLNSSQPANFKHEQSFGATDDYLLARRYREHELVKQKYSSNPDLNELK